MKRLLLSASLVTMAAGAASAAPTAPPAKPVVPVVHVLTYKVAPADEYFGKLKLSILGLRNIIHDDGLKVDADATQGPGIVSSCAYAEDALHDWEAKYPHDSWLPRSIFTLERLYAKIDSDVARSKAKATMVWLVHDFPWSPQAKIGRVELAANKVGVKPVVAEATTSVVAGSGAAPAPSASP
jgi:hypothetical protein